VPEEDRTTNEALFPQRPRNHALERQCRIAFEEKTPPEWTFQQIQEDYGFDGEVQVVTAAGVTGLSFKVQLKATDRGDPCAGLRLPLRDETQALFRNSPQPVLVVVYHAPSHQMFARWFHSMAPHARNSRDTERSMLFSAEHLWGEDSAERLQHGAERFYRLRSPGAFPLTVRVDGEALHGVPAPQIALELRESMASEHAEVGAVGGEHPDVRVTTTSDGLRVDLGGVASCSIAYSDPPQVEVVVHDVMIALAYCLGRLGHTDTAARLYATHMAASTYRQSTWMIERALAALLTSRRIHEALVLEEVLAGDEGDPSDTLTAVLPNLWSELSRRDRDLVLERYGAATDAALAADDRSAIGASQLNLGAILRAAGRHEEAIAALDAAGVANPEYLDQPMYHQMRAGSFWEVGQYGNAVCEYEKALACGARPDVIGLLADALMTSGRYAEAAASFDSYFAATDDPAWEWILKSRMLKGIVERVGEEQIRRPDEAERIAIALPASGDVQETIALMEQAIAIDGLSATAWYNLSVALRDAGQPLSEVFDAMLTAALAARGSADTWAIALALAFGLQDEEAAIRIAWVAYRCVGTRLAKAVRELAPPGDEDAALHMIQFVEIVVLTYAREEEPFVGSIWE
jgi:tetratricopeptide (TPR) repeat protein